VIKLAKQLGYGAGTARLRSERTVQGNIRLVVYRKAGRVVADTPFFLALTEGIEAETRAMAAN